VVVVVVGGLFVGRRQSFTFTHATCEQKQRKTKIKVTLHKSRSQRPQRHLPLLTSLVGVWKLWREPLSLLTSHTVHTYMTAQAAEYVCICM